MVVCLLREPTLSGREGGREGEREREGKTGRVEMNQQEATRRGERERGKLGKLTFVNLPPSVCAVTTDNSKHSDSTVTWWSHAGHMMHRWACPYLGWRQWHLRQRGCWRLGLTTPPSLASPPVARSCHPVTAAHGTINDNHSGVKTVTHVVKKLS